MNDEPQARGNWYLLTGLILGIILGLVFSLRLFPVRYENSSPAMLRESLRNEYRRLIAEAYTANGNLPRARQRLALLQDEDPLRALAAQAQRILADGGGPEDARPLAQLAAALGSTPQEPLPTSQTAGEQEPSATLEAGLPAEATPAGTIDLGQAVRTATPVLPTETPRPTFTPRPTATPPRVLDAPFSLVEQKEVCDGSLPEGRVAVEVFDRNDQPLPGVRIEVAWEGGTDSFFTGLAPEISLGYADFEMQPGLSYTLRVGEAGDLARDLVIPSCGGAVKLVFREGGG